MNVTFTSRISIPRRFSRAINTPHLAWRRLRQVITSSPHYMDSRPPRVARLHDQRKKSEQAPPQTIIYLGIQIDLWNMTLALPQDHVDSPLTMRGGDTFVSSNLSPARVSSGSLLGRFILTPVIVWRNTFSLASRRDDTIQVDEYIHGCTQVALLK